MSRTKRRTVYIVQPYWRQGRGFRLGKAMRFESESRARQQGAELHSQGHGVRVLAVEGEPVMDLWSEPRLLATYGEVPDLAA